MRKTPFSAPFFWGGGGCRNQNCKILHPGVNSGETDLTIAFSALKLGKGGVLGSVLDNYPKKTIFGSKNCVSMTICHHFHNLDAFYSQQWSMAARWLSTDIAIAFGTSKIGGVLLEIVP